MTEKETKTLLTLHCRMFTLENLAAGYGINSKALKLCLKLTKIEIRDLNGCTAVYPYETDELKRRYEALTDIIKRLAKYAKQGLGLANSALDDLRELTEKTQEDISALRENLSPGFRNAQPKGAPIDGGTQANSRKIGCGVKALSDKTE